MKKGIYLVLGFLLINFALAQIFPEMVPVIDPKAVQALSRIGDVLDSILTLHGDELKKINSSLAYLLETQFDILFNKITTDSLKAEAYHKNLAELEKFIQLRKEMAMEDSKTYKEAIKEARTVGAYFAIENLPQNIPCLNPRIRNELTGYVMDLAQEFDLSLKAEETLNKIPDCATEEVTTEISLKPKIFAWLTEPFKLNLAQLTQTAEGEIPSITITPAFQETEDTIELSDLKSLTASLIFNKVKEEEEKREKEIGDTWPVEEPLQPISTDSGKVIIAKWLIRIPGEDLEALRKNLAASNPLTQTTENINVYQKLTQTQSILTQIGITTSSVASSSDLAGTLTDKEEIKKIIDRTCASYAQGEGSGNLSSVYALCLKKANEQLKKLADIKKKEVEEVKNIAENTEEQLDKASERAEKLKEELAGCPGAYNDLEEIVQELGGKVILYTGVISEINRFNSQIGSLINGLNGLTSQIDGLLNQILTTSADIINVVNQVLKLFKSILSWFGLDLNVPIISDILGKLQEIRTDVLEKVNEIFNNFNQVLDIFADLTSKFNQFSYSLYQADFNRSSILNDIYELNTILAKLDAYERLAQTGKCSLAGSPPGVSLIKNQVIVVESKKQESTKINFVALIKNLFQPKLVEIRNEK